MSEPEPPSLASRARVEALAYLELLALTALAVAQPVLDTFHEGADIFVLRRASTADIVLFALAVTFVPALVLYAVEVVAALVWSAGRKYVHASLLGVVAGLILVEALSLDSSAARWVGAVGACVGTAIIVLKYRAAHVFLRILSVASFVFVTLFLVTDPISDIAFADSSVNVEGAAVENPAPVVMVVFDELPTASLLDAEDHIDARLFPNFARLAHDSTWYRNNTGVSPTTPQAVPAIMTGDYPDDVDALPVATSYPNSLFTLLDGAYEMNVWEQATQICPTDLCPPTGSADPTGLGPLLQDASDVWGDRVLHRTSVEQQQPFKVRQSDPSAKLRFDEFVSSIDESPTNRLDFIHVLLPHQPWRYLPSGHRYNGAFIAKGLTGRYTWRDDYFVVAARQRHMLQLQLADAELGELLDRLDETGRYDESLIVVTADHGVAFTRDEPIRGLSDHNQEQIAWTPLLVKEPGQKKGAVNDQPMRTIDVVPTIADILGVDIGWSIDGVPASSAEPRDDARRFYRWDRFSDLPVEEGEDYSVIDGQAGFQALLDHEPWSVSGDPDYWVYRIGKWGDLVGQAPEDIEQGEPTDFTYTLDDPNGDLNGVDLDFDDVDLDEDVIPTYIAGEVQSSDQLDIAVALNGRIVGWGRTFIESKDDRRSKSFFVLAPESLLRDGKNEIDVYLITEGADGPVLHPIPKDREDDE